MSLFVGAGLRLDQAPSLTIPMGFFAMAPLSVSMAGGLLLWQRGAALSSTWAAQTIALTHLLTLGVLSAVMLGALYQLTPVLGGARVAAERLAYLAQACLVVGLGGLEWGLIAQSRGGMELAIALLLPGLLLSVWQVGTGLRRSPVKGVSVSGMQVALAALFMVAFMGVWMAHGFAGMMFPLPRLTWLTGHLTLALLGWVGTLLMAVSLKLVPMFYLSPELPELLAARLLRVHVAGLLCVTLVPWLAWSGAISASTAALLLTAAAAPAAVTVWGLHPAWVLVSLARRRRKRVDPSCRYWQVAMSVAPAVGLLAAWCSWGAPPRVALSFGWLALWGWAGLIVHGMLTRIVPFLVWLHRFSPHVGLVPVPSMGHLYPAGRARRGLWLHCASVLAGLAAIGVGSDGLAALTGALLLAVGLHLGLALFWVCSYPLPELQAEGTPAAASGAAVPKVL